MRERKDLDRKRLPASTYEVWLAQQLTEHHRMAHRPPPHDAYDDWVAGRVQVKEGHRRTGRPKSHSA
jgi:hypothetical protein